MSDDSPTHSAFQGHRLLASGKLPAVARAVHQAMAADPLASVLVFSHDSGRPVDLDLRGSDEAVAARYATASTGSPAAPAEPPTDATVRKGRGRPRLGVVAREVTLLPEHWDWLASQPGGASVALRKLVLQAMRASAGQDALRRARDRSYAFMSAIGGNLPGFEEAARALFAGDPDRLAARIAEWPPDVRQLLLRLAQPPLDAGGAPSAGR